MNAIDAALRGHPAIDALFDELEATAGLYIKSLEDKAPFITRRIERIS